MYAMMVLLLRLFLSLFVESKKEAKFLEVSRETMVHVSREETIAVFEPEKIIGGLNGIENMQRVRVVFGKLSILVSVLFEVIVLQVVVREDLLRFALAHRFNEHLLN